MLKVKCLKHQKEKKGCYTACKSDATVAVEILAKVYRRATIKNAPMFAHACAIVIQCACATIGGVVQCTVSRLTQTLERVCYS